jgi:hypothetical protein
MNHRNAELNDERRRENAERVYEVGPIDPNDPRIAWNHVTARTPWTLVIPYLFLHIELRNTMTHHPDDAEEPVLVLLNPPNNFWEDVEEEIPRDLDNPPRPNIQEPGGWRNEAPIAAGLTRMRDAIRHMGDELPPVQEPDLNDRHNDPALQVMLEMEATDFDVDSDQSAEDEQLQRMFVINIPPLDPPELAPNPDIPVNQIPNLQQNDDFLNELPPEIREEIRQAAQQAEEWQQPPPEAMIMPDMEAPHVYQTTYSRPRAEPVLRRSRNRHLWYRNDATQPPIAEINWPVHGEDTETIAAHSFKDWTQNHELPIAIPEPDKMMPCQPSILANTLVQEANYVEQGGSDLQIILGMDALKFLYLDNPVIREELDNLIATNKTSNNFGKHSDSLQLDYSKYTMHYRAPEILSAILGYLHTSDPDFMPERITANGRQEAPLWTLIATLNRIIRSYSDEPLEYTIAMAIHNNETDSSKWHLHLVITNLSTTIIQGPRNRTTGQITEITRGNYILQALIKQFQQLGVLPQKVPPCFVNDITIKITKLKERQHSLIMYIFQDMLTDQVHPLVLQHYPNEMPRLVEPEINGDAMGRFIIPHINNMDLKNDTMFMFRIWATRIVTQQNLEEWLKNLYEYLKTNLANEAHHFEMALPDYCAPMIRFISSKYCERNYRNFLCYKTNNIPQIYKLNYQRYKPKIIQRGYQYDTIYTIDPSLIDVDTSKIRFLMMLNHTEKNQIQLVCGEVDFESFDEDSNPVRLPADLPFNLRHHLTEKILEWAGLMYPAFKYLVTGKREDYHTDYQALFKDLSAYKIRFNPVYAFKTDDARKKNLNRPITPSPERRRPPARDSINDRKKKLKEELAKTRGGNPRAIKNRQAPEDSAEMARTFDENASQTPENYHKLLQIAKKLELPEPSPDIQKHLNLTVSKKMTELGIFSLKAWVKEYIMLSRCFPTENTFRNFETKIKALEMLLPPKPRQEIYLDWHENKIIFENKTPAELRKAWNSYYRISKNMQEGLRLLEHYEASQIGKTIEEWIINYFLPDWKTHHHPFERKGLLITAPSNSGKSVFVEKIFEPFKACPIDLSPNTKFQHPNTYHRNTNLWVVKDLNHCNKQTLQLLQNIIADSVFLDRKFQTLNEDHHSQPIIVCYAVEPGTTQEQVWDTFRGILSNEHDLIQFKKRFIHAHLTDTAKPTPTNGIYYSDLLMLSDFTFKIYGPELAWTLIDVLWFRLVRSFESDQYNKEQALLKTNPMQYGLDDTTKQAIFDHLGLETIIQPDKQFDGLLSLLEGFIAYTCLCPELINANMDLSAPESEDIRNFMAQYYPKLYEQTKYGFIHLMQLRTRQYIRKILDKQGLGSKKTLLRHLTDVMKKITNDIQSKFYTIDGTWIINGWDGDDTNDPRFILFAQILADADTENGTNLEKAKQFFNDVRNAITASNDVTSDKQAIRIARNWIEHLRDEIIMSMWDKNPPRKHKITKNKKNLSLCDMIIPVRNKSDTLSAVQVADSDTSFSELNDKFLANETRIAAGTNKLHGNNE